MTTKLFAQSNRASLREVVELTDSWSETPTAGVTRSRRFTNSTISTTKSTAVSDEIRDDRMVSSIIETAASSAGDISWEFSAGNTDLDLQRVLMGTWSRPMTFDFWRGTIVAITADNTITIAGQDVTGYITTGRRGKLSGFINPANNRYVEISAAAFTNGNTILTVTDADLVVEGGTVYTTYADANDVIIRNSTAVSFGGSTITAVGLFSAAIAAKQLVMGQKIFVEGLGYESGTVTFATAVANDTITISDGINTFTFEAEVAEGDGTSATNIVFDLGATDAEAIANFANAVNAMRPSGELNVKVVVNGLVATITNLNKTGGSLTSSDVTALAVTPLAGGTTDGGVYTVAGLSNDTIVVDRALPTLAAGNRITIKGSILRNPSRSTDIIAQSMTLETGYNDVSQYFVTQGVRAGGYTLDIASGAIIKGTTTTMAAKTSRQNASMLGNEMSYTVLDAAATEGISATANVGALLINGTEASTALKSITLKIDGSLREQQAVGSKFPVGIAEGRLNITGTVEAYFADGSNFDAFINHDTVSLAFPMIDHDQNTYWLTVPSFKIISDPINPGGNDQDVMEKLDFTAFRDTATQCMLQVDRFSSTAPVTF